MSRRLAHMVQQLSRCLPHVSAAINGLKCWCLAQAQPEYILVENVVGFEDSRTAQALRSMLRCAGYAVQEFLLSPLQLGIPYSRPRYFCIARKVCEGPAPTRTFRKSPGQAYLNAAGKTCCIHVPLTALNHAARTQL